ncbi:hypothetical protein RUM43_005060 [Polyplax serrata]|uniref:Uncharacterized protein n=1 Tax=Polyplax serrata TaxID=468196 RepID=A0AAN8SEY0_POLSC
MELLVFLRVLMMKSDEFGDGDSCKRKKTNSNETMVLRLREDPAAAVRFEKFFMTPNFNMKQKDGRNNFCNKEFFHLSGMMDIQNDLSRDGKLRKLVYTPVNMVMHSLVPERIRM